MRTRQPLSATGRRLCCDECIWRLLSSGGALGEASAWLGATLALSAQSDGVSPKYKLKTTPCARPDSRVSRAGAWVASPLLSESFTVGSFHGETHVDDVRWGSPRGGPPPPRPLGHRSVGPLSRLGQFARAGRADCLPRWPPTLHPDRVRRGRAGTQRPVHGRC